MSKFKRLTDLTKLAALTLVGAWMLGIFLASMGAVLFLLTGCATEPTLAEKQAYIQEWEVPEHEARKIREGKLWIGAAWRDVHAAIGKPDTVSITQTGRHHYTVMRYPCRNLYFTDGRLETIQGASRCSGAYPTYPPPAMPYPRFGRR